MVVEGWLAGRVRFFGAIGLGLIACLLTAATPALAQEKGFVLTQRSKNLGDQYVYLSPSGLKCVNPREGLGIIARGPTWDVCFFNDKTKMYYQTTFEQWKQQLGKSGLQAQQLSSSGWSKSQAGSIAGLRAQQYVCNNAGQQFSKVYSGKKKIDTSKVKSASYWVSQDIHVPPKLSEMLATAYGLPPTQCIPLRLTAVGEGGKNEVLLDTYRGQETPIPVTYYNFPQGYVLAKSEVDVMMTDEHRQMLNDMANSLGNDSPPPTQAQAQAQSQPMTAGQAMQAGTASGAAQSVNIPGVGNINLTKENLSKFLDALKKKQ